jgi:hypothetical protein
MVRRLAAEELLSLSSSRILRTCMQATLMLMQETMLHVSLLHARAEVLCAHVCAVFHCRRRLCCHIGIANKCSKVVHALPTQQKVFIHHAKHFSGPCPGWA